jgi:hypothetical protein
VRVHWSITGAIACMLGARAAGAERIGVVAVTDEPGARAAVVSAMARAIADDPSAPAVVNDAVGRARDNLAHGAVPIETLAAVRRVRELVDEGWRAYLRVEFELAQSRLAVARTEAEQLVALPGGAELYADTSLRLGIVLAALGHLEDSQAAIALALALDHERAITLAEFSPDVVAMVDAVRALDPPTRHARFTSEPPGAEVFIDGTRIGTTPLVHDATHGQHVVVVRAAGFVAHTQAFAVGDTDANIELALDRDDERARLDAGATIGLPDARAQLVVDAAIRFADLDELVLVAATDRRGGEALLVQRCAGSPARCTAIVELGYGTKDGITLAARNAWQAVRGADLRYPPSVLADPRLAGERVVAHHCELCRSPWVWGGASAAAVAAAIAVVAIVTASKPAPVVGVNPGQFFSH